MLSWCHGIYQIHSPRLVRTPSDQLPRPEQTQCFPSPLPTTLSQPLTIRPILPSTQSADRFLLPPSIFFALFSRQTFVLVAYSAISVATCHQKPRWRQTIHLVSENLWRLKKTNGYAVSCYVTNGYVRRKCIKTRQRFRFRRIFLKKRLVRVKTRYISNSRCLSCPRLYAIFDVLSRVWKLKLVRSAKTREILVQRNSLDRLEIWQVWKCRWKGNAPTMVRLVLTSSHGRLSTPASFRSVAPLPGQFVRTVSPAIHWRHVLPSIKIQRNVFPADIRIRD